MVSEERRYKASPKQARLCDNVFSATVDASVKAYKRKIEEAMASFWIPPICIECYGVLSQKVGSARLVCLICGAEYELCKVGLMRN